MPHGHYKETEKSRSLIIQMEFSAWGAHVQSGNIFGAGRRPVGEGWHGVCYVTAVLLKLTQQRQLLKYLLLSDERFCSVSQHSI